jgi:hypothetical protein
MGGHSKSRADKHRKRKLTRRNAETTASHRLKTASSRPPAAEMPSAGTS